MISNLRRFRREDRAAAAVEFALVFPILIVLVFGVIDMGLCLYTANQLTSAVREGARWAAVQTTPTKADLLARIGPQLDNVKWPEVSDAQVELDPNSADRLVTVRIVGYSYSPITPFANLVGLGSIPLRPSATFRWERAP